MDKWISLVDNGGHWNCLLNMKQLTKIYRDESNNGKVKQYFIIFNDSHKSHGHVTFESKINRDRYFAALIDFINIRTHFFLEIETDIR